MRLIDADALNREIDKVECYSRDPYVTYMSECIANAPTVDAVPVIRCKDCKYWETDDDESFCSDWGAYGTGAESYCSFAKRKE